MHSKNRATERGAGGRKDKRDGVTGGIQLVEISPAEGGRKETNLDTSPASKSVFESPRGFDVTFAPVCPKNLRMPLLHIKILPSD